MNINMNGLKNHLQALYQFGIEQIGKLQDHTVKFLKRGLEIVRKDPKAAGATIVLANILIFESALLVAKVADRCFIGLFGPESNWGEKAILFNSFVSLSIISSLVVGMNIALYRGLKSPLTPLATAAISTATCASYILFRLWSVSGANGSEE